MRILVLIIVVLVAILIAINYRAIYSYMGGDEDNRKIDDGSAYTAVNDWKLPGIILLVGDKVLLERDSGMLKFPIVSKELVLNDATYKCNVGNYMVYEMDKPIEMAGDWIQVDEAKRVLSGNMLSILLDALVCDCI